MTGGSIDIMCKLFILDQFPEAATLIDPGRGRLQGFGDGMDVITSGRQGTQHIIDLHSCPGVEQIPVLHIDGVARLREYIHHLVAHQSVGTQTGEGIASDHLFHVFFDQHRHFKRRVIEDPHVLDSAYFDAGESYVVARSESCHIFEMCAQHEMRSKQVLIFSDQEQRQNQYRSCGYDKESEFGEMLLLSGHGRFIERMV